MITVTESVKRNPLRGLGRCGWLVELLCTYDDGYPYRKIVECGQESWWTDDDGSWECAAGHHHTTIEIAWMPFGETWQWEQQMRRDYGPDAA